MPKKLYTYLILTTTTISIYNFHQSTSNIHKVILLIHALQAHHGILRILVRGAQLTRPRDIHQRPSTPLYTSETIQVTLFRIFHISHKPSNQIIQYNITTSHHKSVNTRNYHMQGCYQHITSNSLPMHISYHVFHQFSSHAISLSYIHLSSSYHASFTIILTHATIMIKFIQSNNSQLLT